MLEIISTELLTLGAYIPNFASCYLKFLYFAAMYVYWGEKYILYKNHHYSVSCFCSPFAQFNNTQSNISLPLMHASTYASIQLDDTVCKSRRRLQKSMDIYKNMWLSMKKTAQVSINWISAQVLVPYSGKFWRGKFWWMLTFQMFDRKYFDGWSLSFTKHCIALKVWRVKFWWSGRKASKSSKFPPSKFPAIL